MRKLFLLVLSITFLLAGKGELTLFVFKDGMPLPNSEAIIDGNLSVVTDGDGSLYLELEEGQHQVVINVMENGAIIAHAKQPFVIASDDNTELLVTLTAQGKLEDILTEAPETAIVKEESNTTVEKVLAKGKLTAKLFSSEDNKAVSDAKIFVKGTSLTVSSDKEGTFSLELPEGNQTISIIHNKFSAQTLRVVILPNLETKKSIELTPAGLEMQEFVVLVPHVSGTVASSVAEEKDSSSVAEVMGSAQLSKQGDSSAAGALARANGLTLVGGKYIYVRGLGERYSSSLLNQLHLPSPEPTKRVVPLDMFPTSVIKSIKVQKTYSADLPANFGGGNIDIRTKSAPEEFLLKFTYSAKINDFVTGKEALAFQGGANDWTGFDDFRRPVNETLSKTDSFDQVLQGDAQIKKDLLKNPSKSTTMTIPMGQKLSFSIGDTLEFSDDLKFGYVFTYSYGDDWSYKTTYNSAIAVVGDNEIRFADEYFPTSSLEHEIKHGGLLGFSLNLFEDHTIKQTNFLINQTTDTSSYIEDKNSDPQLVKRYLSSWVERYMMVNQLNGEHRFDLFGEDLKFTWATETGKAQRNEPLTKDYAFTADPDSSELVYKTSSRYGFEFTNSDLIDNLTNSRLALSYPIHFSDTISNTFDAGVEILQKDRDSKTRRYSLIVDKLKYQNRSVLEEDIDTVYNDSNVDKFKLFTPFKAADYYTATHKTDAQFLRSSLDINEVLNVVLGIRHETSLQQVNTYDENKNAVTYKIDMDDYLPEATLTYKLNEEIQFRAGYAETVTRPDFREFAPTRFQDPVTADIIIGNNELTFTEIKHYDVRVEWYPSSTESLSLGVFRKDFINPIETIKNNRNEPATFEFINADKGELSGLEIAYRINFDTIADFLSGFYTAGNLSFIGSKIGLSDKIIENSLLTNQERAMQGQSPYVVNVQLGYDNDNGTTATILYNEFGERIRLLGTDGEPDVYEQPFRQLDFVLIQNLFENFKVKVKATNLLDSFVDWKQGGYIIRQYKKGRSFSAAISYSF